MHKLFVIALLLSSASHAGAVITIDDFSAGPLDVLLTESLQNATTTQVGLPETSVIGGIRQHHGTFNSPVLSGSEARFVIDTNEGTFRSTTNLGFEGSSLVYGYGPGPAIDLELSDYNAFRIDFLSSAKAGVVYLTVKSGKNENIIGAARGDLTFPASASPFSLRIPFSSFAVIGQFSFSDIDYIELNGGAADGFDLVLDGIFVVPEPSTLTLLLAGVAGLALKRAQT